MQYLLFQGKEDTAEIEDLVADQDSDLAVSHLKRMNSRKVNIKKKRKRKIKEIKTRIERKEMILDPKGKNQNKRMTILDHLIKIKKSALNLMK